MRIFLITIVITVLCGMASAQTKVQTESFLEGTPVVDIADDGENLWFATGGSGIYKYDKKRNRWKNYSTKDGTLQMDLFYSIAANERYVWAGSADGLFMLDKRSDRWSKRKFGKGGQLSNWIRSVVYDPYDDVVWIGRFKYLSKLDIRKRRFADYDLTVEKNLKTNTIQSVAVDGDSLVWFGTEAGLHKFDKAKEFGEKGALKFYDNSLNYFNGDGDVPSISEIIFERENVWIGLDEFTTEENPDYNVGGIYVFDRKNTWTRIDSRSGLNADGISALEKTGNYIWAALYQFGSETKEQFGRGVAIINRFTLKAEMLYEPYIPETVYDIHFDGESIWLAGKEGVTKIKITNELAEFTD